LVTCIVCSPPIRSPPEVLPGLMGYGIAAIE
jgi:hypothetical protein